MEQVQADLAYILWVGDKEDSESLFICRMKLALPLAFYSFCYDNGWSDSLTGKFHFLNEFLMTRRLSYAIVIDSFFGTFNLFHFVFIA